MLLCVRFVTAWALIVRAFTSGYHGCVLGHCLVRPVSRAAVVLGMLTRGAVVPAVLVVCAIPPFLAARGALLSLAGWRLGCFLAAALLADLLVFVVLTHFSCVSLNVWSGLIAWALPLLPAVFLGLHSSRFFVLLYVLAPLLFGASDTVAACETAVARVGGWAAVAVSLAIAGGVGWLDLRYLEQKDIYTA